MNIFILDYCKKRSVQMLCDKHVVKMPLETAQVLCSVYKGHTPPYKVTHYNHPCSIWARYSLDNFLWLIDYGITLCNEYEHRYGRVHKSLDVIKWCRDNMLLLKFDNRGKSRFAKCVPEQYDLGNAVDSYRAYYLTKKDMFTWKNRKPPSWIASVI